MPSRCVSLCSSLLTNSSPYKGLRQSVALKQTFLLAWLATICKGSRFLSYIFYLTPGSGQQRFF